MYDFTHAAPCAQAYVALSWVMTDEELSVETELALGFLDYLLTGTNASPMMKVGGNEQGGQDVGWEGRGEVFWVGSGW